MPQLVTHLKVLHQHCRQMRIHLKRLRSRISKSFSECGVVVDEELNFDLKATAAMPEALGSQEFI